MHVLITGVTGFVGGHLAEALLARGDTVIGLAREASWPKVWRHLGHRVPLISCDLVHDDLLDKTRELKAEWVFHLAGYAHVGQSFREPEETWNSNLLGTRRFLDALKASASRPRILFVSSGLVYGDAMTATGMCDEGHPLRPASPYAASKAAADLLAYQYTRHPGLDIVRVRPFNHIGPRQAPLYAIPRFASQIAAIEHGAQPPVLETGDLTSSRDLTDVRDMVQAYVLLLEKGLTGEVYNAGRGEAFAMHDVLARLLRLSTRPIEVRQCADQLRPTETSATLADATRLRTETGWKPHIDLDQTLADTLEYWRSC